MDARETPAAKAAEAAAPQTTRRYICTLVMHKTYLTQEEIFWHILACAACCYPETDDTWYPSDFFLRSPAWCTYAFK